MWEEATKKKRVGHSSAGKPGRRLGGVRLSNMRRDRLHDSYWVWGKGRGGEGVIRLQFSLAVAILRAGEREEDRCDISPPYGYRQVYGVRFVTECSSR